MPIDDVQYLLRNSEVEEMVTYVDSSQRNKTLYPSPNGYAITFSEPFRDVVGVNVLNCLTPRTVYNVDVGNNKLRIRFMDTGAWETVAFPPLDYTLDDLLVYWSSFLADRYTDPSRLTVTAVADDLWASGMVYVRSDVAFELDLTASTIREVIGMDEPCTLARDRVNYVYQGICLAQSIRDAGAITTFDFAYTEAIATASDVAPQTVTLPNAYEIESVTVTCELIRALTVTDAAGATIMTLTKRAQVDVKQWRFAADNSTYASLKAGATYTVSAALRLAGPTTYVDVVTITDAASAGANLWLTGMAANSAASSARSFLLSVQVSAPTYTIYPPGLVSLAGERCVLLRCPEIEQHINGSYIYGNNSPGLALITLGTTGFSTQRMDFTSITYRNFHPIGKLMQVTFRFETTSGELYNFKGVNHTIVLAIKYLVHRKQGPFDDRVLNANYNPDYLAYMIAHEPVAPLPAGAQHEEDIDEFFDKRYEISDASGSDSEVDINLCGK